MTLRRCTRDDPRRRRGDRWLPGLTFPGDPDAHPTKDQVADYLATYEARFDLPVRHGIHWLDAVGSFDLTPDSARGRRMRTTQLVIGTSRRSLRRTGVIGRPRLTRLEGRTAGFADDSVHDVDAVVWATGFRADHSFVRVEGALDEGGAIRQRDWVAGVPGLWTVGMPWQRARGSALLGFVGRDADTVASSVTAATTAARQRSHAG